MKKFWQRFGKSLLMPISTIAAMGLLLGIAAALQDSAIVGEQFVQLVGVQNFIGFIRKLVGLIFGNLPLFFALSITLGMVDDEKPTAAYASILGFLVFHLTLNYILDLNGINAETTSIEYLMKNKNMSEIQANIENARYSNVLGFFTYRMDIFAGIIVGLFVAWLHNCFHTIQLPSAINFFGGRRFVPIITVVTVPIISIISYFLWPMLDQLIGGFGNIIQNAGMFGPFIYGLLNRLLIPTGLHHILNQLVYFTPVGGTAIIDGIQVNGALNIYSAALTAKEAVPNEIFQIATRFIGQGHMIIVIFGLPAAMLAIIKNAKPENKNRVKGLLYAGLAACMMTGITEPLEFSFMFVSPMLFIFHAIMTGFSYMVMALLKASVGNVQAGLIDFIIFGVIRGPQTKWYLIPIVGILFGIAYYKVFDYMIRKYDLKTPGRVELVEYKDTKNSSKDVMLQNFDNDIADLIVIGLGGVDNIIEVENCFTRLRVRLIDENKVDKEVLKQTNPSGIVRVEKNHIQIIYGLKAENIARDIKKIINID